MSKIDGGEMVVRVLEASGYDTLFGLCGGHLNPIYNACRRRGIKIIGARHEGAAAHMADAWGRLRRKPGVCLTTAGPGYANALPGVAAAYHGYGPLLWLSGMCESDHYGMGALQELDQDSLARPITRFSKVVADPQDIGPIVSEALRIAITPPQGPVHVSIPVDVLLKTIDPTPPETVTSAYSQQPQPPDPSDVGCAVEMLCNAQRPVIIAGDGLWFSGGAGALRELAEVTAIPVFTIGLARGAMADDHPLCFGYPNPLLNGAAREIARADVVLVVGRRLNFRLHFGGHPFFSPEVEFVRVDIDPAQISRNVAPEIGIVSDARAALEAMTQAARAMTGWGRPQWLRDLASSHSRLQDQRTAMIERTQGIHPATACRLVRDAIPKETIVVADGGNILQWARGTFAVHEPGHWLEPGQLAPIGICIPFAIGAALACPNEPVVSVCGDGSFGFYPMEFESAARHGIAFVCVIANDGAWGIVKDDQIASHGPDGAYGTDLPQARYEKIAEIFGGYGEYVDAPEQIRPAIERAIDSGKPACVNVKTAYVRGPVDTAFLLASE